MNAGEDFNFGRNIQRQSEFVLSQSVLQLTNTLKKESLCRLVGLDHSTLIYSDCDHFYYFFRVPQLNLEGCRPRSTRILIPY